ncbi:hypothetical protein Alo02nite_59290 [Actinoplanes lobatus]|uniref:Uncharacterized protein n=1 Tax=Actinoplanes lobatus TaxID=113568 RepID=A0ABQ4APV2_9ACTN|nr:hypothetical protein Alo02nite_59290 [Actinoplanes lobatus]
MPATTTGISVGPNGLPVPQGAEAPSVSTDGRYVAFQSFATTLVPGDTNRSMDVFVHDRQTGRTERVSVDTYGREATDIVAQSSISADGRYVSFITASPNLSLRPDTNHASDVFVRDRSTGITDRVSVMADGSESPKTSLIARISADGRHVAFESDSNLVPETPTTKPTCTFATWKPAH